jgi:heat shock protein HslJ
VSMMLGDADELSGSAGCNRFTGTWSTGDDRSLTLNAAATTMMACEGEVSGQETAFLQALADTASHQRDGGELTLRNDGDEELAVFRELESAELTGTEWAVTGYNNGQEAVVSVIADTRITAVFGDDDRLNGNAGCNTYMTGYSTEDDRIAIEPPATTRMACDQPVMDQEVAYLAALERAATFELGDHTLELRGNDGALLVSYSAVE